MRIYLTQHGLAVPKDVDPDRPLSEQGRKDARRLSELPDKAGIQVGQVLHSRKTRAEQTAAILTEALLPEGQPEAPRLSRAEGHSREALPGNRLLVRRHSDRGSTYCSQSVPFALRWRLIDSFASRFRECACRMRRIGCRATGRN